MNKKIIFLTMFTMVGVMGSCQAKMLPSGTSGVINVPTAHVRSIGHVSIGAQGTENGNFVAANLAIIPGVEVAATHWNPKHGDALNMYSAKLEFLPETAASPALAVGVEDVTDKSERAGYVVATKDIPWGLRVHAGAGTGRFKKGFVALEKDIKFVNLNLSLAAEYDGHHFNYGAAVPLAKFLQAEVGVRSKDVYAGVNFTF
jgi:hypothetical protein